MSLHALPMKGGMPDGEWHYHRWFSCQAGEIYSSTVSSYIHLIFNWSSTTSTNLEFDIYGRLTRTIFIDENETD
jgi:hypothetical protein